MLETLNQGHVMFFVLPLALGVTFSFINLISGEWLLGWWKDPSPYDQSSLLGSVLNYYGFGNHHAGHLIEAFMTFYGLIGLSLLHFHDWERSYFPLVAAVALFVALLMLRRAVVILDHRLPQNSQESE